MPLDEPKYPLDDDFLACLAYASCDPTWVAWVVWVAWCVFDPFWRVYLLMARSAFVEGSLNPKSRELQ